MKKMYFVLGIFILSIFVSCATTTIVFDESIPLTESAILNMQNSLTVTLYNGIEVGEPHSSGFGKTEFIIPAGYTELLMDLNIEEPQGRVIGV